MSIINKLRKNKEAVYKFITLPVMIGEDEEELTFRVRAVPVGELLQHVKGLPRLFQNIEGLPESEDEISAENLEDFYEFLSERLDVFEELVCMAVELQDEDSYIPFVREAGDDELEPSMLGVNTVSMLAQEVITNFRQAVR